MKLFVLTLLYCSYVVTVQAQQGNADGYLDSVLDNARNDPEIRSKIDPLVIDDLSFDKGSASNVRIYGLASLGRRGPATLNFQGTQISVDAHVGLDRVNGDGRYNYRVNKLFKFSGAIGAKVDSINCNIRIVVDGTKARLDRFAVTGLSGIKVTKFTGATVVFNWLAKFIVNIVIDKNRGKIRNIIENEARQAIQKALDKVDIHNFLPK